jgi:hypothetical protein
MDLVFSTSIKDKPIKAKFKDYHIAHLENMFPGLEITKDDLLALRREALRFDDPFFNEILSLVSKYGTIEIKKVY